MPDMADGSKMTPPMPADRQENVLAREKRGQNASQTLQETILPSRPKEDASGPPKEGPPPGHALTGKQEHCEPNGEESPVPDIGY